MHEGIDEHYVGDVSTAIGNVNEKREACSLGAIRRAQLALEHEGSRDRAGDEWLGSAAVLVHVDQGHARPDRAASELNLPERSRSPVRADGAHLDRTSVTRHEKRDATSIAAWMSSASKTA